MSIPDGLAYLRIALIPAILALILPTDPIDHSFGIAATLMAVASMTDWADGYLARRWQITTALGAFLDSIADKLLVSGALFGLVAVGRAWAWAAFVIVGREIAVSGLRGVAAMDGVAVPPSFWGKAKANVQYMAIFLALLRPSVTFGGFYPDQWVMLAAVAVTLMSGYGYFSRFAVVLRSDRARA
ncbi:MAG: CDP-diacylglycerol--glycerol-3-phosphate 3-phosphatidyltransferase [Acidimicrobiia bacterium]|nr:MAG: CDP-diacylglycerol--glycerol-3-phosphate 3-phosphatidyltransferase [Acidimicrobiia bacterium]